MSNVTRALNCIEFARNNIAGRGGSKKTDKKNNHSKHTLEIGITANRVEKKQDAHNKVLNIFIRIHNYTQCLCNSYKIK